MFYARFFALFFLFIFSSAVFAQKAPITIKINPVVDLSIDEFSISEPFPRIIEAKASLKNNGNTVLVVEPVLVIKSQKEDKKIFLLVQLLDIKESKEVKAIVDKSFFAKETVTLELQLTYYPLEEDIRHLVKSALASETYFVEPPGSAPGSSLQVKALESVEGLPESTVLSFLSVRNKSKEEQHVFLFSPVQQNIFLSTEVVVPPGTRKMVPITIKMPQKSTEITVVALSEKNRAELSLSLEVKTAFPPSIVAFYQRNIVGFFFLDWFYSRFLI